MKEYEIYLAKVSSEKPATSAPTRRLGTFIKDAGSGERRELVHKDEVEGSSGGGDAGNLVFNSNVVYVRGDSDASVSNGYYYAPYRTIAEALAACTRERNTIMILDNHTYSGDITLQHGKCENLIAPHAHLNGTVTNDEEYATIKLASCNQLILNATAYVFIDDCNDISMIRNNVLHGHISSELFYRHSPSIGLKANKQVTLTASTPLELSFSDLQVDFPFNLEFLKLDGSTATPVDIPYEFTSIDEYQWVVKLNPTETSEVLVMARG